MKQSKFTNFPAISREEWLSKITNEYRGKKSISDLYLHNDNITRHPFHHPSDIYQKFRIDSFPNTYSCGIKYSTEMPLSTLLALLEAGVSNLYIEKDILWKPELENKIRWDYLNTTIINNNEFYEKLVAHAENNDWKIEDRLCFSTSEKNININLNNIATSDNSIDSLINNIRYRNDLEIIEFHLSDHFLFNIGFIRGLIKFFNGLVKSPKVIGFCTSQADNSETSLIKETTQMVSARLAGIPSIFLSYSVSEEIYLHKAMIPHILDLESKLIFSEDPITGSQYLDHLSNQVYHLLLS